MTTPTPLKPSTAKAWVALIGGLIISQGPLILQMLGHLPAPWGVVFTSIGSILAAFTGVATHQTSYMPPDTVIAPTPTAPTGPAPAQGWQDPYS